MPTRDPWFDNAKYLLVVLVVIGHAWTLLPENTANRWFYDFLYAWHVPAFVIVTGYLSRGFEYTPKRMRSLFETVLVPYVLFEGLLAAFRLWVGHEQLKDLWANPHWPMWYLSALFFWRLLTPIFKRMPSRVVVAVAISLVAGVWAGDTLDMARVLGLLPFFVLGLKLHPGHWEMLRHRRARILAVLGMLVIVVLTRFTDHWISSEWLYYRSTYSDLNTSDIHAATVRLVLLIVGLLGSLSFFALVPRGRTWFTSLGAATLIVYLFHGFAVLGAEYAGYPDWTAHHLVLGRIVTGVAAIAVALFLAWPPVARRLTWLVDPLGSTRRKVVEILPSSDP